MKKFSTKLAELLNSTRFWMLTGAAVIAIIDLKLNGVMNWVGVLQVVKVWLVAIVGVGTLDSVAEKSRK